MGTFFNPHANQRHHGAAFSFPLLVALVLLHAGGATAQIKITSGNLVGIRAEPQSGVSVTVSSGLTKFYYANNRPFQIYNGALDPRINSTNKVVFYNTANTTHIDVEAKSYLQVSDERLKTGIRKLSEEPGDGALAKLMQLDGVSYDWKDAGESDMRQSGFLAQQLEQVMPETVVTTDSSGMKLVNYSGIIPYLVEAIKEQQSMIEELKVQLRQSDVAGVREEEE